MTRFSQHLIVILALIFTLSSCTKFGKNITVKGRVLNPITKEGYGGVTILLIKSKNLEYYGGYKSIKETTTDKNGNFEISAARLGSIWIEIDYDFDQNFYTLGWDYNGKYYSMKKVEKGEVMHVDYHMVPYGKYRLKIQNVNCGGVSDSIVITQQNEVNSFSNTEWFVEGCNGYTTSYTKTPMGNVHTTYTVIRGGNSQTYEEDFEVKPHQKNEQVINY